MLNNKKLLSAYHQKRFAHVCKVISSGVFFCGERYYNPCKNDAIVLIERRSRSYFSGWYHRPSQRDSVTCLTRPVRGNLLLYNQNKSQTSHHIDHHRRHSLRLLLLTIRSQEPWRLFGPTPEIFTYTNNTIYTTCSQGTLVAFTWLAQRNLTTLYSVDFSY